MKILETLRDADVKVSEKVEAIREFTASIRTATGSKAEVDEQKAVLVEPEALIDIAIDAIKNSMVVGMSNKGAEKAVFEASIVTSGLLEMVSNGSTSKTLGY